jgi:hypothetical protein
MNEILRKRTQKFITSYPCHRCGQFRRAVPPINDEIAQTAKQFINATMEGEVQKLLGVTN